MKALHTFVRGAARGVPPPAEWMLEITNRCNLTCPMCLRHRMSFAAQDMDPHFVRDLLQRNPAPEAIWLYGYGEPLLYPHLFDAIREVKQRRIVACVSTNATLLDDSAGRRLLDSGLDYLIIAFDGATRETYEQYRKGAGFLSTKGKVERFIALKHSLRSRLHLTMQLILLPGNRHQASAFTNMWRRPGVNAVRTREDLLKSDAGALPSKRRGRHRPCFFLWRGPLFIQARGTIIPCPYYHGQAPFGDLQYETAESAWNSPKMQELRNAHLSGDLSRFPVCASCPRYQPHRFLAAASFLLGTRVIRRYLPVLEKLQQKVGWKLFE
jgi:MoaA/NifB/PqqE/SkfB family radical SAM enzyme